MSTESTPVSDGDNFIPGSEESSGLKPLRVWPAALLLLIMFVLKIIPSLVNDGPPMIWMVSSFGPLFGSGLLLVWWVTFSRASMKERLIGLIGALSAFGLTTLSLDISLQGPGLGLLTVPIGMGLFGITAILVSRHLTINRTFLIVLVAAAGFGSTLLLKSRGMTGEYNMDTTWRWVPSTEDQLVADSQSRQGVGIGEFATEDVDAWLSAPEWPSFRGDGSGARQTGTVFSPDWTSNPPQELWKITVGPAWSSFAVAGQLLFTQEQRGEQETVVCYAANSGKEVWKQQIESRFWDPLGGPGPRATPALAEGSLYVQGAAGMILQLDARTGEIQWEKDLRELAQRDPLEWGFSSSPLVVDGRVIVYGGGEGDLAVFSLDAKDGKTQWSAAAGDHSYCSPTLVDLNGQSYITMLTNTGVHLYDPATGEVRLDYDWPFLGYRAVQPRVVDGDSLLLPTGNGAGTRRIRIASGDDGLAATEVWTSKRLKPDFNDFVVHQGFAYGFDNKIIACIDLSNGKSKWKGGRYGKGQMILLADSDILLVLGEQGQIVLLSATPDGHKELAKVQALEGKTWNHPVVVGDRLYIRNYQEASCWQLPIYSAEVATTAQ